MVNSQWSMVVGAKVINNVGCKCKIYAGRGNLRFHGKKSARWQKPSGAFGKSIWMADMYYVFNKGRRPALF